MTSLTLEGIIYSKSGNFHHWIIFMVWKSTKILSQNIFVMIISNTFPQAIDLPEIFLHKYLSYEHLQHKHFPISSINTCIYTVPFICAQNANLFFQQKLLRNKADTDNHYNSMCNNDLFHEKFDVMHNK